VNAVVDRLQQCAESLEAQPVALLHGDLHLQNFFVEGDRVALIDLDDLCLGSPWQDIGSFSAALHYRGILAGTPLAEIDHATDLFYRRYSQKAPWFAPRATVDWYTAAALINERAFRSISRLQSGSLDILDAILARAQKILMR
jgi:aminoglycoside phosphotransferase (APT) family kinase protein